jgi:hypothetical protein
MTTVTTNSEQRLFVIPAGEGYSCLGFEVAFKYLRDYCKKLGRPAPSELEMGTLQQYAAFREAEAAYIATKPRDTQFDADTPLRVQTVLEAYRKSGDRARLFFGDVDTGRDWLSEHDVLGRVSRTAGPLKAPILVEKNASGGSIILSACILKIVDVATKKVVYQHAQYHLPNFEVKASSDVPGYGTEVWVRGSVHARFKTKAQAHNWIAFMKGERMRAH